MSKHTYDIEFAIQSEVFVRVQADSEEEAIRIAKDRFHKMDEITLKSSNMDREIVKIHMKEEPCNSEATNQDMVVKYKYGYATSV
jgi:hypothetical protein